MKTLLLVLTISLCSFNGWGQEDRYTSAMLSAIESLDQASGPAGFKEVANRFERIALAEKSRWLPYYYASYTLIVMSYDENDMGQRDLTLDRAQELLDQALKLEPGESELHVLQAFLYPSRILVDPMGRGATYMGKAFASLEKAKKLNPDNPRAYFLEGIDKLNLPSSMGGGSEEGRRLLETALEKFEAQTGGDPLWPTWGEDATRSELEKLQ